MVRQDILDSNETDRERLLHILVHSLASASALDVPPNRLSSVHLAYYRPVEVGDLAINECGEVGWVLEEGRDEYLNRYYLIQSLGTDKEAYWNDTTFRPIVGLKRWQLLKGEERAFAYLCRRVISESDRGDLHRYSYTVFKEGDAIIHIRIPYANENYEVVVRDYKQYLDKQDKEMYLAKALLANGWGKE